MLGTGYLTSNSGTAWPFDPDQASPPLDRRVASLFADGAAFVGEGPGADVWLEDVLLDTSDPVSPLSFTAYGPDEASEAHPILSPGEYTVVRLGWCFFVLDNHAIRMAMAEGEINTHGPFRLDPSAIEPCAARVVSFSLWNHYETGVGAKTYPDGNPMNSEELAMTHSGISGQVEVRGGTNVYAGTDISRSLLDSGVPVGISIPASGTGDVIAIGASPGNGTGTVPCVEEEDCGDGNPGASLVPDAYGDVVIEGDGCFQVSAYEDRIRLTGRCTACCQCQDYVETGNRLGEQGRTALDIKTRLAQDISEYNTYADRFNEAICRVSEADLLVKCVALAQRIDVAGAHSVRLNNVTGSIDRGQGVLMVGNASSATVQADIMIEMDPMPIIMANVVGPGRYDEADTVTKTIPGLSSSSRGQLFQMRIIDEHTGETIYDVVDQKRRLSIDMTICVPVECDSNDSCEDDSCDPCWCADSKIMTTNECCNYVTYYEGTRFTKEIVDNFAAAHFHLVPVSPPAQLSHTATLPPGSSLSMRVYGARNGKSLSPYCRIDGGVIFSWEDCAGTDAAATRTLYKSFSAVQSMEGKTV